MAILSGNIMTQESFVDTLLCHFISAFLVNHVCSYRWNKASEWETSSAGLGSEWKLIAGTVMDVYKETTDGSFIETKESALVWHYQNTDHDFGPCQAKELASHLERVLGIGNEPVIVKRGHQIVEVKPQVCVVSDILQLFVVLCI
jgi:trehalose-phosphatase